MRELGPSTWALTFALAGAACAARPLDLAPNAPAPPTCPITGCVAMGDAGTPGGPEPADSTRAATGLDRECRGTAPETCTERALAAWSAADEAQAIERVLPSITAQFTEACALGASRACLFGGRLWLDRHGGAADPHRGLAMLVRACDGGLAAACLVGAQWVDDPLHAKDVPRNQELHSRLGLESACWSGQSDACFRAGASAYGGQPAFPRDRAFAARLYARGCDLGDSRACNGLGVALDYGEGVAPDPRRSAAFFARACHLGDALGCANFGYMAEYGEGIARDRTRARDLYRQACVAGDAYGCLHLEMMAAQDRGAPREPAQAVAAWTESCEKEHSGRACAFMGVLYEDGPAGVVRDEARSLEAMKRACTLHEMRACEWVKDRNEDAP